MFYPEQTKGIVIFHAPFPLIPVIIFLHSEMTRDRGLQSIQHVTNLLRTRKGSTSFSWPGARSSINNQMETMRRLIGFLKEERRAPSCLPLREPVELLIDPTCARTSQARMLGGIYYFPRRLCEHQEARQKRRRVQ